MHKPTKREGMYICYNSCHQSEKRGNKAFRSLLECSTDDSLVVGVSPPFGFREGEKKKVLAVCLISTPVLLSRY